MMEQSPAAEAQPAMTARPHARPDLLKRVLAEARGTASDRHLLQRFIDQRDERAFGEILDRHEPLLLCYLEGLTQDEAATQLGWSLSTLRRRLERGRTMLRARMIGRGATLGAGLLASVVVPSAVRAALSAELRDGVLRVAASAW